MLATEYLWMPTCECITVGGLLSMCVPTFHSHLEIIALSHTNKKTILFLSLTSHNSFIILIVYFVKFCKITV